MKEDLAELCTEQRISRRERDMQSKEFSELQHQLLELRLELGELKSQATSRHVINPIPQPAVSFAEAVRGAQGPCEPNSPQSSTLVHDTADKQQAGAVNRRLVPAQRASTLCNPSAQDKATTASKRSSGRITVVAPTTISDTGAADDDFREVTRR